MKQLLKETEYNEFRFWLYSKKGVRMNVFEDMPKCVKVGYFTEYYLQYEKEN